MGGVFVGVGLCCLHVNMLRHHHQGNCIIMGLHRLWSQPSGLLGTHRRMMYVCGGGPMSSLWLAGLRNVVWAAENHSAWCVLATIDWQPVGFLAGGSRAAFVGLAEVCGLPPPSSAQHRLCRLPGLVWTRFRMCCTAQLQCLGRIG